MSFDYLCEKVEYALKNLDKGLILSERLAIEKAAFVLARLLKGKGKSIDPKTIRKKIELFNDILESANIKAVERIPKNYLTIDHILRLYLFLITFEIPDQLIFDESSQKELSEIMNISDMTITNYINQAHTQGIRFEQRGKGYIFNETDRYLLEYKKSISSERWDSTYDSWPVTRFIQSIDSTILTDPKTRLSCSGKLRYDEQDFTCDIDYADVFTSHIIIRVPENRQEYDEELSHEASNETWCMNLQVTDRKAGSKYRGKMYFPYRVDCPVRDLSDILVEYDESSGKIIVIIDYEEKQDDGKNFDERMTIWIHPHIIQNNFLPLPK